MREALKICGRDWPLKVRPRPALTHKIGRWAMKHTNAALASSLALFLILAQPVLARPDDQVQNDDSQRTSQQEPKVKPGSKDDVDAIGNRDVGGGRGLGNWYSLETEIRMGREYAQMIDTTVKLVQDPVITEYVNRIGQNIVRNSDARVPFTIKVIDSDEVNAFALPGGFFFVNTGLLLVADEEAELAGVMAHEVAHVAARHAMRQMTRGALANIASIPLIVVGGGIGYAAGVPMSFISPWVRRRRIISDCNTCTKRDTTQVLEKCREEEAGHLSKGLLSPSKTVCRRSEQTDTKLPRGFYYLNNLREGVNSMGKLLAELEERKSQGSEAQQMAVQRSRPHLVALAAETTEALNLLRARSGNVMQPQYKETVADLSRQADILYQTVDAIVDYHNADDRLDKLEASHGGSGI